MNYSATAENHSPLYKIRSLFIPDTTDMPKRRYDLDWLRVLAFGLLILYHTGMFYVESWGWHVKSNYQSQFLENIMLFIEPWRMPILWLIAGISIRFIIAKVSITHFIIMRSYRLLLPLLFGILVVVPPQLYVEMTANGDLNMNYWQFLQAFFTDNHPIFENYQAGIWPHIDVNHLWFIRSLWQYSLMMLILLPVLNNQLINRLTHWFFKQHAIIAILLATLPIFLIQITWDIDSSRYPIGFAFMVYGYLLGWNKAFWQRLDQASKPLLLALVLGYVPFVIFYNVYWLDALKGNPVNDNYLLIGMFNYSLQRIVGILAALALAVKFLNKESSKLDYLNEAVYPFYILHQTVIVVLGYNLSLLSLGPAVEPVLLILLTVIACLLGYEAIRRTTLLRPCFGLRALRKHPPLILKLGYMVATLLILPLAWKLLKWSAYLISTT